MGHQPLFVKAYLDDHTFRQLRAMQDGLVRLCTRIDVTYAIWQALAPGERKAFALLVTASDEWHPVYFGMWQGQAPRCVVLGQAGAVERQADAVRVGRAVEAGLTAILTQSASRSLGACD